MKAISSLGVRSPWPGPQKVQFGEITGYPEVVGLILALLSTLLTFHFCNLQCLALDFTYSKIVFCSMGVIGGLQVVCLTKIQPNL